MRVRDKKSGLTLVEILVVVAIISLLVSIGISAGKNLMESFENSAGVKALVSASLANARAIAAKEGKYAGVRFQCDRDGNQYMVLIIHDPAATGLANGFRAVVGRSPMKLPRNVLLMDMFVKDYSLVEPDISLTSDTSVDEKRELTDTTTFSILFSPAGKLVIHDVRIRNRDGNDSSLDNIFNTKTNVDAGVGMFYQDDYASEGFDEEPSRGNFVAVDKLEFNKVDSASRYSDYLQDVGVVYINPHTGEIVN